MPDGGFGSKDALKPRLTAPRDDRAAGGRRPIGLLKVSPIDDDHIGGIKAFFDDEVDRLDNARPLLTGIRTLWHNSFDDIVGNTEVRSPAMVSRRRRSPRPVRSRRNSAAGRTGLILASVPQGRDVRDAAKKLVVPLNAGADRRLITSPQTAIDPGDGLAFTVLGSRQDRVDALQKEWDKQLKARRLNDKTRVADRAASSRGSAASGLGRVRRSSPARLLRSAVGRGR